jgi:hypothetical protein
MTIIPALLLLSNFGGQTLPAGQAGIRTQMPKKIASLFRNVVEGYVSLRYLEVSADRAQTISKDGETSIRQWLQANPQTLAAFAGKAGSTIEEALTGWISICSDFAAREAEAESKQEFVPPAERVRRLAKGFAKLQVLYRKNATATVQAQLAATTYYMLNGALLVSPVDDYDFEDRLLVPDLGLTQTATIANYVVTPSVAAKLDGLVKEWFEKIKTTPTLAVPNLKWYAEIKPGAQVLGLRKKGDQDWIRTANWMEVAQKASRLESGKPEEGTPVIEVLIGTEKEPTRVFEMLSW